MSSPDRSPLEKTQTRRQYCFGDFVLDLDAGFLKKHTGEEVTLRPKSFEVLACLVQHAGHLVTKSTLIDAVWADAAVTDNSLTQWLKFDGPLVMSLNS